MKRVNGTNMGKSTSMGYRWTPSVMAIIILPNPVMARVVYYIKTKHASHIKSDSIFFLFTNNP
jgi:hypothetical protein